MPAFVLANPMAVRPALIAGLPLDAKANAKLAPASRRCDVLILSQFVAT
jgi:hypothetical protein